VVHAKMDGVSGRCEVSIVRHDSGQHGLEKNASALGPGGSSGAKLLLLPCRITFWSLISGAVKEQLFAHVPDQLLAL